MSELTVDQLIKIILGIFVVIVVIIGIYMLFKNYVIDFFKNIGGNSTGGVILSLLK